MAISEAFTLIRDYALQQGWTPIGFRSFQVGPWRVTVNGTTDEREQIPPYHALIQHDDIIALMLISPFGGSVGGWQRAEDEFIVDMQAALARGEVTP